MALPREFMNPFPLVTSPTHEVRQSEHRERFRACARQRILPAAARGNELIRDIQRSGISDGLGKPEALKYLNAWSRRITQEHRLVYRVEEDRLLILACRGHYE